MKKGTGTTNLQGTVLYSFPGRTTRLKSKQTKYWNVKPEGALACIL
jgi:hypothetical protein